MTYARKIQKIGESLFVSLPKKWVEQVHLNQGNVATLVEQPDGSVAVYPEIKKDVLKQISLPVKVNESKRSLRRRIVGAYVDGFDVIVLRAGDKLSNKQQDIIREITETLFGLEIIEVTSHFITVQCLLTKTLPIDKTILRIHNMMKSMFSETISALKERNSDAARSAIKTTHDIKRLSLVVHRLLRSLILFPTEREPEMKPIDSVDFLRVIDKTTEISASVKEIAESVIVWDSAFPDFILEPLLKACAKVLQLYDWCMEALMSSDIALANRVLDEKLELHFDDLWELVKMKEKIEISGPMFSSMHRIVGSLRQTYAYALEIAEIAIDRAEELSDEE